jgi:hypothetical protein
VYVKCIAGQQGEAKRRIEDAMRPLEGDGPGSTGQPRGPEHPDEEHSGPRNLDAYLPQTAAHSRHEPDTTAYGLAGTRQSLTCMPAGQGLFLQVIAESVVSSLRTLRTGSLKTLRTVVRRG